MNRSRRSPLFALLLLLAFASVVRADLASDIRAALNDKLFAKGDVGVEVIRLGDSRGQSQTIFQHRATIPRIPASNLKLVTTAAAMDKLGGDFAFKTTLAGRGGRDLAIIGDGDPTFGDAEMLRKAGWDVSTVFVNWAEMLKKRGVTEVGDVYVDDSIFDEIFLHPNWPLDQAHKRYVPQVGGVNLNANCVDFFLHTGRYGQEVDFRTDPPTRFVSVRNSCVTGNRNAVWLSRQLGGNDIVLRGETNMSNTEPVSVTIHDPPMFAATVLAETLRANGIRVTGQVQRDRTIRKSLAAAAAPDSPQPWAERWAALAVHTTPLAAVLNRANKDSMNLYAEALCKRIGAEVSGASGSWENGNAVIGTFLESLGVESTEFKLDDGCGLSKQNMISPNAIARVLEQKFYDSPADREMYMSSLAVAGVDGTLESRFRDSDLRGRVLGKSGYVAGVRSLSGYLKSRDGQQWHAFSILMNSLPDSDWNAKVIQERIVKAIDSASSPGGVASGR